MAWRAIGWLLLSLALWPCRVLAQAPGDENSFCLEISSAPAYASSVKPLLDSWRYRSLLGDDGVWTTEDLDEDPLGWTAIPSSICQEKVMVQEPSTIPQENWLFTQYISKSIDPMMDSYSVNIFVNVSYTFESECENIQCSSFVQLYYYLSNNSDRNVSMNTSDYSLIANLSYSDQDSSPLIQFSTSSFSMKPEDSGFYLAVLDTGSNVTIHRILAYRIIGPMEQIGLTLLPETPAPMTESIDVTGTCIANSNTSNGDLPTLTLSPMGTWTSIEPCYCIVGHYMDEIEGIPACVACDIGTYKSDDGNEECLPCPENSESLQLGAAICTCLSSYYRSPDEMEDDGCTGPPSFPLDVIITDVTPHSANITWNPPLDDGGRNDTYYNISYIAFSQESSPGTVYPEQDNQIIETHYMLTDLQPCIFYYVVVSAENGVSLQAGGQEFRSLGQSFLTPEAVPQITTVEVLNELYIYWMPLSDYCVSISYYHIQFRINNDSESPLITVPNNETVYRVNLTHDLPPTGQPIYVVVRGSSPEDKVGKWSEPVLFAEENPNSPPTVLPTSSSIPTGNTDSLLTSSSSTGSSGPTVDLGTTSPSTSPESPTSDGAILSIVFVLLGALVIIILVATGALVYWLVKKYCGKHLKHLLPSPPNYMSVRLTRSTVGDEEGRVEFVDGSKDEEETEDKVGLIKPD